jgi:hypothetical protein
MHLLQVFSLVLSFIMLSSAFPNPPLVHVAQITPLTRFNISDFLISDLTLLTFPLADDLSFTHTLSCMQGSPNPLYRRRLTPLESTSLTQTRTVPTPSATGPGSLQKTAPTRLLCLMLTACPRTSPSSSFGSSAASPTSRALLFALLTISRTLCMSYSSSVESRC